MLCFVTYYPWIKAHTASLRNSRSDDIEEAVLTNDTMSATTPLYDYTVPDDVNTTNSSGPVRDEHLAKVEITVQAVILVLAVFGNGCVLFALRYRQKKTSRMHLFIMHLSIADLMVAFCNVLPQLAWDITFRFQGGDFLCRTVTYAQIVVMYSSTYILVITAFDRYRAICYPMFNYAWTSRRIHTLVAGAWLLSMVLALPQIFIFSLQEIGPGIHDCWATFQPAWTVRLYITTFAVSVYILPFIILTGLYSRICYVVWSHARAYSGRPQRCRVSVVYKFNGTGSISAMSDQSARTSYSCDTSEPPRRHNASGFSRSKLKTIKLTFVVISAYLLCWSPFMVTQMWWAYDENAPIAANMFVVCILLASLNSCCNPWIYMAFSGNLVRQMLPCCRRRSRRKQRQKRNRDRQLREGAKPDSKCGNFALEGIHPTNRRLLGAVDSADCSGKGDKSSHSSASTKSTGTLLPDAPEHNSPTIALLPVNTNNGRGKSPEKDKHSKTRECRKCVAAMTPRHLISCRRFSTKFKSNHEHALYNDDMKRSRCQRCNTESSHPNKRFKSGEIEQKCTSI